MLNPLDSHLTNNTCKEHCQENERIGQRHIVQHGVSHCRTYFILIRLSTDILKWAKYFPSCWTWLLNNIWLRVFGGKRIFLTWEVTIIPTLTDMFPALEAHLMICFIALPLVFFLAVYWSLVVILLLFGQAWHIVLLGSKNGHDGNWVYRDCSIFICLSSWAD